MAGAIKKGIYCVRQIVTMEDHTGPSWDTSFSYISALAPTLNVIMSDEHFLNCFAGTKTAAKWKKLAT